MSWNLELRFDQGSGRPLHDTLALQHRLVSHRPPTRRNAHAEALSSKLDAPWWFAAAVHETEERISASISGNE